MSRKLLGESGCLQSGNLYLWFTGLRRKYSYICGWGKYAETLQFLGCVQGSQFLFPAERLPLLCNLKFPKLCGALR